MVARPETNERNRQIDAMRGIAAFAVLMYHFTYWFGKGSFGGIALLKDFATPPFVSIKHGHLGVELFFMISGFVLPASAFRYKSMRAFVRGRILRLFPAYWLAVIFASVVYHVSNASLGVTETYVIATIVNLTMIQTLLGFPSISGVFWTLYVELQFYLLLIVVSLSLGRSWFLRSVVAIALLHLTLFITDAYDWMPGLWRLPNHLPLLRYMQYFMLGSVVHSIISSKTEKCSWTISILAILIFVVGNLHRPALLLLAVAFYLACNQSLKILETRVLIWLGTISYSLYLFHSPVGYFVLNRFQGVIGTNASIILSSLMSIVVATLVCFYVERPIYIKAKMVCSPKSNP